jgi:hypothetical protein
MLRKVSPSAYAVSAYAGTLKTTSAEVAYYEKQMWLSAAGIEQRKARHLQADAQAV